MVPLSLFCFSAFTWSASSGASVVYNINAYTEESPTKSIGGFGWKEINGIPEAVSQEELTPRILNGKEALVGDFPWMASIHVKNQGHSCGGSIISQKHILTAAHCVPTDESIQMTVLVGVHFQDESLQPRAQRIAVNKAIEYSNFSLFPLEHDIAMLVLEKKIELNDYTAIINLPSEEYLYGDVNVFATGWGRTYGEKPYEQTQEDTKGDPSTAAYTPAYSDGYDVSPVLKVTNLTIFNNTECDKVYKKHVEFTFDGYKICAAASRQTGDVFPGDTTLGDSGGPLFLKENDKWVVVGITSSGHSVTGHPLPGVYTRVSAYLDWIIDQMSNV